MQSQQLQAGPGLQIRSPLLLLPEPAAAILENGPTYEIPAEEHQLPSVADAEQRFSLDAQHAMEYPLPSAPGKSRYAPAFHSKSSLHVKSWKS